MFTQAPVGNAVGCEGEPGEENCDYYHRCKMRERMSPVYHAFLNLFSPFLDEKPKKKEEVNVLGDQERKVEQKKVDR